MDYMPQKATITGKSYAAVLQNLMEAIDKFNDRR
jgi:predicted RNase H-like HicB family nuclease